MGVMIKETRLNEITTEVSREELINLAINLIPYVSSEEMEEINTAYINNDELTDASGFVDMTKWLGR
ncbi:hypothetical protein MBAV_002874 [Candidatus Magnetobacterium bavaricum]|uniref:Uncharacterized protein n=1 Tax=Candidatus Magnetobacterium bavaricum TaxID=29290 RepID=A0A0F3GSV7_9BACT|nr:hypothetical protein MBAV_002874 [Candidatus Magnetobacterium bavaricum]